MPLEADVEAAFLRAPLCWLATAGADGPNVVPVGFKWVWEGRLLLADLFFDKTRENLRSGGRVSVAVATAMPKAGFQLKGNASIHRDGPAWQAAIDGLAALGVGLPLRGAVLVEVDEIWVLDPGATGRR